MSNKAFFRLIACTVFTYCKRAQKQYEKVKRYQKSSKRILTESLPFPNEKRKQKLQSIPQYSAHCTVTFFPKKE